MIYNIHFFIIIYIICNWTVSALNFITDSYIPYIFLIVFRTSSVDFQKKMLAYVIYSNYWKYEKYNRKLIVMPSLLDVSEIVELSS